MKGSQIFDLSKALVEVRPALKSATWHEDTRLAEIARDKGEEARCFLGDSKDGVYHFVVAEYMRDGQRLYDGTVTKLVGTLVFRMPRDLATEAGEIAAKYVLDHPIPA